MKKKNKFFIIFLYCIIISCNQLRANWSLYIEGAYAYPSYSDISIPRSTINEFSLTDNLDADGQIAYRTELRYAFNKNHRLELLIAPLSITAKGVLPKNILFKTTQFSKGDIVDGLFRFDSYRIRYRYFFKTRNKYFKSIGFTAKIRDAEITLETDTVKSQKLNTGFVPLLNFIVNYPFKDNLNFEINGDALFSQYGRAEDIFLGLNYQLNNDLKINFGYRVVEGGSDVEEVYSFTWINYILLGIEYKL
ncbi:MAG: hypothetical protein JW983_05870 [Elusimicrobia bacterium]|nr:hypothetical protein [Elusimicrobiota bacterium]